MNKGRVVHAFSDIQEGAQAKIAAQFNIKKQDLPVIVGYIPRGNHIIKNDVRP